MRIHETSALTGLFIFALSAVINGLFAARKNRNAWAWALFGGLFCLPTLLILAFVPFLCPKCQQSLSKDEWKRRRCPHCGVLEAKPSERTDFLECPSCSTLIPPDESKCPRCGWS